MKKKHIFFLVAAAILITLLPIATFAGEGTAEVRSGMTFTKDTTNDDINKWADGAATISANDDGTYTVTLQKNISITSATTPVTFGVYADGAEQPMMTLDLNGYTISSVTIALSNMGNLTVIDSVGTGKVIYTGGGALATVQNGGYSMTIKGGTFECQGAGMVTYNAAVSSTPSAKLTIDGGIFEGNDAGAIVAYGQVTINGGTLNGKYGVVSKQNQKGDAAGEITFPAESTAVVNADSMAFVIQGDGETDGKINAEGGTFNAPAVVGKVGSPDISAAVSLTGGTYSADPSGYVKNDETVARMKLGDAANTYIIGADAISEKASEAAGGDEIEIISGDIQLQNLPDDISIINSGEGTVTANGQSVTADEPLVTHTHQWGEPVWTWANDYSSAQITFTCVKNDTHTVNIPATISEQTTPATCTDKGSTVYTATAEFENETYTDTRTVDIEPVGHDYGDEWKSDENSHWKECECGDKAEESEHTFEWIIDKEATETEAGSKHEECTICGYKKEAVEIPVIETEDPDEQPDDPDKQPENPDNKPQNPDTSDSVLILWSGIACAAAAGLFVTTLVIKRKIQVK